MSRKYCCIECAWKAQVKPASALVSPYRQVMVAEGTKLQHRRVMEELVGRKLARLEFVHHKNGVKTDNRPENLEIVSPGWHGLMHLQKHPFSKDCVICGTEFVPDKTKRARQQTCGRECKSALMSLRNRERQ